VAPPNRQSPNPDIARPSQRDSHALRMAVGSTDNTRFATASYDETVRIWDAVDGTTLTTLKPTPKAWCRAVSFSIDDNDLLITRFQDVVLYHRQWSERWWGYFFRFEFCLFVVVSVAFL